MIQPFTYRCLLLLHLLSLMQKFANKKQWFAKLLLDFANCFLKYGVRTVSSLIGKIGAGAPRHLV